MSLHRLTSIALGVPDPAAVEGPLAERVGAFRNACLALESRIKLFVALPLEKLDRLATTRRVGEIGRLRTAPEPAR